MSSRKITILALTILFCGSVICGLFVFSQRKNAAIESGSMANVTIKNGLIVKGDKVWESFKTATYAGQEAEITLQIVEDDQQYDCNLKYDGQKYSYYDSAHRSYRKTHLLDLKKEVNGHYSRWIVLANDSYTFDDLTKSIESSNSNDFIDFEIIFGSTM